MLRFEAAMASEHGIDVTKPGWGDELDELIARMAAEGDHLIATPHVDQAIDEMERQFEVAVDDAR